MEVVKINENDLQIKEWNGQRVITLADIDRVHERPEGTAKRNFSTNKKYLIENEDYFMIKGDDLKTLKQSTNFVLSNARSLIFLTESGYLLLVKSFTDDLAWKVQRQKDILYYVCTVNNNITLKADIKTVSAFLVLQRNREYIKADANICVCLIY